MTMRKNRRQISGPNRSWLIGAQSQRQANLWETQGACALGSFSPVMRKSVRKWFPWKSGECPTQTTNKQQQREGQLGNQQPFSPLTWLGNSLSDTGFGHQAHSKEQRLVCPLDVEEMLITETILAFSVRKKGKMKTCSLRNNYGTRWGEHLQIRGRTHFMEIKQILSNKEVDFRKCLLCLTVERKRNEHHETRDERWEDKTIDRDIKRDEPGARQKGERSRKR